MFGGLSEHWLDVVADPIIAIFWLRNHSWVHSWIDSIRILGCIGSWRLLSVLGHDVNHSNNVSWETIDIIATTSYPSNSSLILLCRSVNGNILQRLPLLQGNWLIDTKAALVKQFGIWWDGLLRGRLIIHIELSEIIEAVNKLFEALNKFQLQGRLNHKIVNLGVDV